MERERPVESSIQRRPCDSRRSRLGRLVGFVSEYGTFYSDYRRDRRSGRNDGSSIVGGGQTRKDRSLSHSLQVVERESQDTGTVPERRRCHGPAWGFGALHVVTRSEARSGVASAARLWW